MSEEVTVSVPYLATSNFNRLLVDVMDDSAACWPTGDPNHDYCITEHVELTVYSYGFNGPRLGIPVAPLPWLEGVKS